MNAPLESGQLNLELLAQALVLPLMDRTKFAQLSGIDEGVLKAWIAKGYIPTYQVGKYRLINLALLNQMALNKAFTS